MLAVSAAAADGALPVGEADGVRIVQRSGGDALVFTKQAARMYRRIAGKRVTLTCTTAIRTGAFEIGGSSGTSHTLIPPKRRRPLPTRGLARGMDYCRVWLPRRVVRDDIGKTMMAPEPVVSVPLTQAGAVYLDEEAKARDIFVVLAHATFPGDERSSRAYPTPAQLIDSLRAPDGGLAVQIVALGNPGDTPPAGIVGYYSDGRQHAAVATTSASGRRLFIELLPDDELRTNVLGYIFADDEVA